MIMGRPEWAWVRHDAPAEETEAAMAALAALRLLPLGLDQ